MRVQDEQENRFPERYSVAVVQLMIRHLHAIDERAVRTLEIARAPCAVGRADRAMRARQRQIRETDIVREIAPDPGATRRQRADFAAYRTGHSDQASVRACGLCIERRGHDIHPQARYPSHGTARHQHSARFKTLSTRCRDLDGSGTGASRIGTLTRSANGIRSLVPLWVLKSRYLLPALMFHPSADTLLADDVRPRVASTDCTELRALTCRVIP